MSVSDFVCALSQQPKSFGRTVPEAIALWKHVAVHNCGGVEELFGGLSPGGSAPLGDQIILLETVHPIIRGQAKSLPGGEPYTLESMCPRTFGVYLEPGKPC